MFRVVVNILFTCYEKGRSDIIGKELLSRKNG